MSARKSRNSSWRRVTLSGQLCDRRLTRTRWRTWSHWVKRCQVSRRWPATGSPDGALVEANCARLKQCITLHHTMLTTYRSVALSLQPVQ